MRNVHPYLRLAVITVAVIGLLTACQSKTKSTPSQLDAPSDSSMPLPGTTQPPLPSATFEPTVPAVVGVTLTPQPTLTPYPTRDRTTGTEEPLDNAVAPGKWLNQTFMDATGTEHTLAEFSGRLVVVQFMSASCDQCMDQQRVIVQTAQDRYDYDGLSNTVFLALDVEQRETPALFRTVLENQLAEDWSTVKLLERDDIAGDWLAGLASPQLLDVLARDFGPAVRDPDSQTIILVEPDGTGHLAPEGLLNLVTLRSLINFYMSPVATD